MQTVSILEKKSKKKTEKNNNNNSNSVCSHTHSYYRNEWNMWENGRMRDRKEERKVRVREEEGSSRPRKLHMFCTPELTVQMQANKQTNKLNNNNNKTTSNERNANRRMRWRAGAWARSERKILKLKIQKNHLRSFKWLNFCSNFTPAAAFLPLLFLCRPHRCRCCRYFFFRRFDWKISGHLFNFGTT